MCPAHGRSHIGMLNFGGPTTCENFAGGHTCYSNTTGVACDYYGTGFVSCYLYGKRRWLPLTSRIKTILLGMVIYFPSFLSNF